jgi:hypothetical protein
MSETLPRIIAICGCKRVGKDTVAEHLRDKFGYKIVKFAEPLKDMLKVLFGFSHEQIEITKDVVDPMWGVAPRKVMQFFGTEIMQFEVQRLLPNIDRGFFVKSLLARHKDDERIVISDMRFIHEWQAIKNTHANSLIIKITRNDSPVDDHVSEMELEHIDPDFVIENNGTLESLFAEVDRTLSYMHSTHKHMLTKV